MGGMHVADGKGVVELSCGLHPAISGERIHFNDVAGFGQFAKERGGIVLGDAEAVGLKARRDFCRRQRQQMAGKAARALQNAAASFPGRTKPD